MQLITAIFAMLLATLIAGCGNVRALDLRVDGLHTQKAQISGLTILDDRLILLPQNDQGIYWIPLHELDEVIQSMTRADSEHSVILVKFTEFNGEIPELSGASGWEAVDVGGNKGERTLFLAHEDIDGHHAIFRANVRTQNDAINIAPMELYRRLPLPKSSNTNYAYEALAWFSDDELIVIPELSSNFTHAVRLSVDTHDDKVIALQRHGYRITDMSSFNSSQRHILATSFCWRGEGEQCNLLSSGDSNSLLLCLQVDENAIFIIGEHPLPVDVLGGNQEFNAEGIVVYKNGILIVNDNYPGNTQ